MSKAWSLVGVSTFACLVCFAVWALFGVIGIAVCELGLSTTEFGLLTAIPTLGGALLRVTGISISLILIFFMEVRRADFRGRQPPQPAAATLGTSLR